MTSIYQKSVNMMHEFCSSHPLPMSTLTGFSQKQCVLLTTDVVKLVRLLISEVFLNWNNLNRLHRHTSSSPSLVQMSVNTIVSGKARTMSFLANSLLLERK